MIGAGWDLKAEFATFNDKEEHDLLPEEGPPASFYFGDDDMLGAEFGLKDEFATLNEEEVERLLAGGVRRC